MKIIDEEFVRKLDDKLIIDDIELHARPYCVVYEWMNNNNLDLNNQKFDSILMSVRNIYTSLYPSGDFSLPPLLSAGVAIRDHFYPVKINLAFGITEFSPLKCIDISEKELENVFKYHPDDGWRAFYGVLDLWDFAYGFDDIIKKDINSESEACLSNARSQISTTCRTLMGSNDLDGAIQSACLTAELSLKGALFYLGENRKSFRDNIGDNGHNLVDAAKLLVSKKSSMKDEYLIKICSKFPNYSQSRYSLSELTRLDLMNLAMRSIFIASEAIRRISTRNVAEYAESMETSPRPEI